MTTILTRRPRPEDADQWRLLWDEFCRFYKADVPEEATAATWSRVCEPDGPVRALVAEDGQGRLVGFAHYLFHLGTWTHRQRCYLEDLFVTDRVRGTGVGRRLMAGVVEAASAADASEVYWQTEADNRPARRLYDRVGELTPYVKYRRPLGPPDESHAEPFGFDVSPADGRSRE